MEILRRVNMSLQYMPQNELKRYYDRPYDTGYFLDSKAPFNSSAVTPAGMGVSMESGELEYDALVHVGMQSITHFEIGPILHVSLMINILYWTKDQPSRDLKWTTPRDKNLKLLLRLPIITKRIQ